MEITKFPHNNWYLEFTEEQRHVIDNWRINIIKYFNKPCPYNVINYQGAAETAGGRGAGRRLVEITFHQFQKYVLGIEDTIQIQEYDYLIPILNKLKQ